MNASNGLNCNRTGWRGRLLIIAGAFFLLATAAAEEPPTVGASSEEGKAAPRVSAHVLAAQRRAQEGDASAPRVGLQSQMHKESARRHLAAIKL